MVVKGLCFLPWVATCHMSWHSCLNLLMSLINWWSNRWTSNGRCINRMLICASPGARRTLSLMHGLIWLLRTVTCWLNSTLLLSLLCQLVDLGLLRCQYLLLFLQNLCVVLALYRGSSLGSLGGVLILLGTTLCVTTRLNMLRSLPISHAHFLGFLIETELLGLAHRAFCSLWMVV